MPESLDLAVGDVGLLTVALDRAYRAFSVTSTRIDTVSRGLETDLALDVGLYPETADLNFDRIGEHLAKLGIEDAPSSRLA
ncbi:hypothetical protein [Sphingomonas sp. M1A8_2b]